MKHYIGYQRRDGMDYTDPESLFFVTVCVKPRRAVFITKFVNEALLTELHRAQDDGLWSIYLYCIMPDHLHLLVRPGSVGLSEGMRRFKGRFSVWWRKHGDGQPLWQGGFFDHRLRSDESLEEKIQYVLNNPVRAGLTQTPESYPWSGLFGP